MYMYFRINKLSVNRSSRFSHAVVTICLVFFASFCFGQNPQYVSGPEIGSNCELLYSFDARDIMSPTPVANGYSIDFGDGTTTSTNALISHSYSASGNYTVVITWTGGSWTQTFYALGSLDNGNLPVITASGPGANGEYSFYYTGYDFVVNQQPVNGPIHTLEINLGDGTIYNFPDATAVSNNMLVLTHVYSAPDNYAVTANRYYFNPPLTVCPSQYTMFISSDGDPCCSNFAPIVGQRYWLSAWVKEDHDIQVKSYSSTKIEVEFIGGTTSLVEFTPTGDIIEGWQRIVGDFIVPTGTTDLKLHMVNVSSSISAYFDDVRVHPFNASMKSYVYDPETLWLTAELDDNNYATFYEYDKEGQLIRIKKETSRGIMTIQESRSSNPKAEN